MRGEDVHLISARPVTKREREHYYKQDARKRRLCMFDSREMLDLGFAFLNAGEVNFHEGAIKNRSGYQNVAGIVNLALACELFIKCLLNVAGVEARGHKIEDLWREYKNVCGDEASEIELAVMNCLVTDFTFEEMLHNDSNVFYNYRYLYDPARMAEIRDNPLKPQFLRNMTKELNAFLYNKLVY